MTTKHQSVALEFVATRARLYGAVAVGLLAYLGMTLLPMSDWLSAAALKPALAWDLTTIAYLIPTLAMIHSPDKGRIRQRAKAIDIRLGEIIAIVVLAGAFSLFAVAGVLERAKEVEGTDRALHLGIGVLTVFLSWVTLHVIYAVHYAHLFYDPAERKDAGKIRGGLEFPETKEPDYWDFVYFSLVIGMTCQVSDVQVTARHMRHLVTAQGIIAFFYNTVIVALAVNIAAGLN
ncbi:DUF1345 domain-containing protein [Dongia sp.]|uniref:DUF1345 domain-containing protein n=1 Tax=Dongia sp. TaxID=1977262 RepID=UPI003752006E